MTSEQIQNFITTKNIGKKSITINFKNRQPLVGVFAPQRDFEELKEKNLWRIVTESKMTEWLKSGDTDLVKIFSGNEILKLSLSL
jgi:hypothetical protein